MGRRSAGEGSVYQTPDGKWHVALELGYSADGKRRRKHITGKTKREVEQKLFKARQQLEKGTLATSERQTVAQFIDHWLSDIVALRVRPTTLEGYADVCRLYIVPAFGHVQLNKVTPQAVQAWLSRMVSEGRAPKSIKHIRAVFKQALDQAVAWNLIARNPVSLSSAPRVPPRPTRIFTPDQARQFLRVIQGLRQEALYVTTLTLGLRRQEVLGLRWQDIDFEAQTVTIAQAVIMVDDKPIIGETKTASSRRTLPLPGFLADLLALHYHRQQEERATAEIWEDTGLVFPNRRGRVLYPTDVLHAFHKLLDKAGLPRMRFHDLRHSCASLLAAAGVHPRVAMSILGHSTIQMTQDLYTHVYDEGKRDALDSLADILKETEK